MRRPSLLLAVLAAAVAWAPGVTAAAAPAPAPTVEVCGPAAILYPPAPPCPDGEVGEVTDPVTTSAGAVPEPQSGSGSLPRTGWQHLFNALRIAGFALALGALLSYLGRRAERSRVQR